MQRAVWFEERADAVIWAEEIGPWAVRACCQAVPPTYHDKNREARVGSWLPLPVGVSDVLPRRRLF